MLLALRDAPAAGLAAVQPACGPAAPAARLAALQRAAEPLPAGRPAQAFLRPGRLASTREIFTVEHPDLARPASRLHRPVSLPVLAAASAAALVAGVAIGAALGRRGKL